VRGGENKGWFRDLKGNWRDAGKNICGSGKGGPLHGRGDAAGQAQQLAPPMVFASRRAAASIETWGSVNFTVLAAGRGDVWIEDVANWAIIHAPSPRFELHLPTAVLAGPMQPDLSKLGLNRTTWYNLLTDRVGGPLRVVEDQWRPAQGAAPDAGGLPTEAGGMPIVIHRTEFKKAWPDVSQASGLVRKG